MELQSGTTAIEVKLLSSGRYTWNIKSVCNTHEGKDAITKIREFNTLLKAEFPDYAQRGSGRVALIDEE